MPEKFEPQFFKPEEAPKEASEEVLGKEVEGARKETETILKEKEIAWENKMREIEEITDPLGEKIDDGIKETVAAFNLNGFPTSGSCEGHLDRGKAAPWIEVSAPNQPEERFEGEKEVFQRVADKYKVSFETVKRGIHHNAYVEALKESSNADETPEYKQWRKENKKLMGKADSLLEEFYREKEIPSDIKLIIDEGGEGEFRIHNGGKDYNLDLEKLTNKQKGELSQRLSRYQKEMQEFGKFLKEKYLRDEN